MKNITKKKSFQYGAMSVVLTSVILILVVLINATFTLFSDKYHLYVDMTDEQLFTLSETSKELLHDLHFDGKVSMIFLQEKDKIEDATYEYKGDFYLKQVHELALDYQAEFPDLVELVYVDMYSNPGALSKYNFTMYPTDVIFDNHQGMTKIFAYTQFFANDTQSSTFSPYGFYGEHRITSALLSLCTEKVNAYVTTGHGESEIGEAFKTVLESCGYSVETVNLAEITTDKLLEDHPQLVIILNPQTEFLGVTSGEQRNEINKLKQILSGSYDTPENRVVGNLMIFADPGSKVMALNELILTWGMSLNVKSADLVNESQSHCFGSDSYNILPQYASDSFTSSLISKLLGKDNYSVLMSKAGTVTVDTKQSQDDPVVTGPILQHSKDAQNNNPVVPASGMPVMAIAQNKTIINNIDNYNYVVACADSTVVSDLFLTNASCANEALITNIARATVNKTAAIPESVDTLYKDYIAESNVTGVSALGMKAFLIFMAVVIPVGIIAVGIVVNVRRKRK